MAEGKNYIIANGHRPIAGLTDEVKMEVSSELLGGSASTGLDVCHVAM